MKKIFLALAVFGATFSFTACGDDSSSSGKSEGILSCDMKIEMAMKGMTFARHFCGEVQNTVENKKEFDETCVSGEDADGSFTAIMGVGCPSGEKKVCEDKKNGGFLYVYDEDDVKKSCEKLLAEYVDDEEDSEENGDSSDSKSDGILSCDMERVINAGNDFSIRHFCGEISNTAENKNEFEKTCLSRELGDGSVTVTKGTSCPSGVKKACEDKKKGGFTYYFYDEFDATLPCEYLLDDFVDEEDSDDNSSDSESDDLFSCDTRAEVVIEEVTYASHSCVETSDASMKKVLDESCAFDDSAAAIKAVVLKGTGCSSDANKVCEDKEDKITVYFYDEDAAEKSCEELLSDDDEEEI